MRRLEQLKAIADESLAGLNATDDMRRSIRASISADRLRCLCAASRASTPQSTSAATSSLVK